MVRGKCVPPTVTGLRDEATTSLVGLQIYNKLHKLIIKLTSRKINAL